MTETKTTRKAADGGVKTGVAKAKVYFTKEISPESLVKIFEKMCADEGRELRGKVGVKISTGEPGGHNFLAPALIGPLVKKLDGTIVECCTAYGGKRQDPADHWKAIKDHGFKAIAPVDLMDEFGEVALPVENGFHLKADIVGEHFENYDSFLVLSHFKGHAMGGFGGALKNMSIGFGSTSGKVNIHTAGKLAAATPGTRRVFSAAFVATKNDLATKLWQNLPAQDDFLESMADACSAIIGAKKPENLLYVSVANKLSVDCDCDSNPAAPEMADLGIFASVDPVALDQACYDAVKNADDPGKAALIERMDSRHAIHTVEAAAEHGLGSREYEVVEL